MNFVIIILLFLGITAVIIGIILLKKTKNKTKDHHLSYPEVQYQPEVGIKAAQEQSIPTVSSKSIFEDFIRLATADGILTANEKNELQQKATELGLNYQDFQKQINQQLLERKDNPEAKLINPNEEKGYDFEKFIVQKFAKEYFTILEWTSDKYVNGIYAKSNQDPDIKIKFQNREYVTDFAVECKYKTNYFENGIEWAKTDQFENYKKYAQKQNIKVFVAIGVGGSASAPDELFIIPLDKIQDIFLSKDFLKPYKKINFKTHNIFYNYYNTQEPILR